MNMINQLTKKETEMKNTKPIVKNTKPIRRFITKSPKYSNLASYSLSSSVINKKATYILDLCDDSKVATVWMDSKELKQFIDDLNKVYKNTDKQ